MNTAQADDWDGFDRSDLRRTLLHVEDGQATAHLVIEGMHCASCAQRIETALRAIDGVERVAVSAATKRMQVNWNISRAPFSALLRAIANLGFRPQVLGATDRAADVRERRTALNRLAVAGLAMMQVMTFAFALYAAAHGMEPHIERFLRLVSMLVTVPVVFYSAVPFFDGAWRGLKARRLGMDLPVSVAIVLAFAASVFNTLRGSGQVYYDSVTMFVFFLLLGRFVEMRTRHDAGGVSEALARLMPRVVQRVRGEQVEPVGVSELEVGDIVLVAAGGIIPSDGRVLRGTSRIDESLLTGESTPLQRAPGQTVVAGSLNITDPIYVEVTAVGSRTTLSGIVRLLERAQTERPRLARAADRAAAHFIAWVLLAAALVAGFWGWRDPARAFPATLAVLVVTCPCALSLATPTAIAAATARLARLGLLVTRADAIEALALARYCMFDKTGTLTQGTPRVSRAIALGGRSIDECLAIAGVLERQSEHPLAVAFIDSLSPAARLQERALSTKVAAVRVIRGRGLEGTIETAVYRIGQLQFVHELAPGSPIPADVPQAGIFLADSTGLLAAFEVDDALRPSAVDAVKTLATLGLGLEIASGDHPQIVGHIAGRLGIKEWRARLTPDAKLARVRELNRTVGGVVVIGDGINDAPVLSAASVSIAMGGGSSLAHASADMVLMSESLATVAEGVKLARRTMRVMHQNLWWAAGYNLVAVPLAALGWVPPWAAAIGMSVSSVVVVLNAQRLSRSPRRPDPTTPLPLTREMAA
jgi:Cu2+-exporting ATPase